MNTQAKKQTFIVRGISPKQSVVAVFLATSLLVACGDDNKNAGGTVEDGEVVAIVDKTVSGVSQKGPFVNGSSVTVQELDGETLAQTGNSYEGKIKNDMGEFSVKVAKLASQYALLKANGFYRNEVTGVKSKSQITLYALTDLSDRDEVNVNLLTHLAYERSLYLATGKDSLSVSEAKKQAETEVLKSFGIEGDFAVAEDLNIFGEGDQSAALLAVSVLMQGDLSEADFSERLANYAADIEADGVWNDAITATKIADWANFTLREPEGPSLAIIRENITQWNFSTNVPEFEKYVNNFWWQNYGLGACNTKREGEIMKNQNIISALVNEYYICKSNSWQVASDIEKDTYKWLDPAVKQTEKDGDVRYGDVVKTNCYVFEDKTWRRGNANDCSLELRGCTALRQDTVALGSDKVWYICDTQNWRKATDIEKDTYKWEPGKDADVKNGDVVKKNCYVFEDGAWRSGNEKDCSLKLRGCTALRQDTVGKGSDEVWYICDQKNWRKALALEYDTYQVECSRDGKMLNGNINVSSKYVCDDGIYRTADTLEIWADTACTSYNRDSMYVLPFVANQQGDEEPILIGLEKVVNYSYYKCTKNGWILTTEKLNQGTMVDERDGHVYQTIGIKSQMWMAENLNYADSVNYPSMLGRNWCLDDKDSCARYGRRYTWSAAIDSAYWSEQGITCGYGEPFCNLPNKVQGICPEGWHIPKKSEYIPHAECSTNCPGKIVSSDDEYGFSPILSVGVYRDGNFDLNLDNAYFWSANDEGASYAYCWSVFPRDGAITGQKNEGISVRCVKDEE